MNWFLVLDAVRYLKKMRVNIFSFILEKEVFDFRRHEVTLVTSENQQALNYIKNLQCNGWCCWIILEVKVQG